MALPSDGSLPDVDVSCIVHVHSTYSDGTATVAELLADAANAGADALLLTDHDTLGAKRDGWDGRHDGVLLVVGVEVSPRGGHFLAFGVDAVPDHRVLRSEEIVRSVLRNGGVGFAAHPFSTGGRMLVPAIARRIIRPHGWPLHALDGAGIELWSLGTDAAEHWRSPREAIAWIRDPARMTVRAPPSHLAAWDALSARTRVAAIGGLDAHAPGVRIGGRVLSPIPNRTLFRLLRTHAVCRRAPGDDPVPVLEALRSGCAFVACPHRGDATGARVWAELDDGRSLPMGGETLARDGVLRVRLPAAADIRVIRDGALLEERHAASRLDVRLRGSGVVRIEAEREGGTWLLSNPVHLRRDGPSGRRERS